MMFTKALEKATKIAALTKGEIKSLTSFPDGSSAFLIEQPGPKSKHPFYTIAINDIEAVNLKLLTLDEKKKLKKFGKNIHLKKMSTGAHYCQKCARYIKIYL